MASTSGPTPNTTAFPVSQSSVPATLTTDLEKIDTDLLERNLEALIEPPANAFFTNWARTFECRPERVYAPRTPEQCRQIVELARRLGKSLHPVGVGHSPSDLGCTNGWLVRMEGVNGALQVSTFAPRYGVLEWRQGADGRFPPRTRRQTSVPARRCMPCMRR